VEESVVVEGAVGEGAAAEGLVAEEGASVEVDADLVEESLGAVERLLNGQETRELVVGEP
jgi:hypothetical protein